MTMGTRADWYLAPEDIAEIHWHMRDVDYERAYYLVKEVMRG